MGLRDLVVSGGKAVSKDTDVVADYIKYLTSYGLTVIDNGNGTFTITQAGATITRVLASTYGALESLLAAFALDPEGRYLQGYFYAVKGFYDAAPALTGVIY